MAESIEALKEMLEAEKSARIQAEDKYLQSINFISEIKNTLPGILYIFDIGLNKNTFNSQQVNSFLGYPAEEQLVFDFNATSVIIHPEDRAKFEAHRQRLKNAYSGETLSIEYRVQHKTGDWKWLLSRESIFSRTTTGDVREIIGSAIDVTEKKSIINQFSEVENLIQNVINTGSSLIFISDKNAKLLLVNNAMAQFVKTSSVDLIGKDYLETLFSDPDLVTKHREADKLLFQNHEEVQFETILHQPDQTDQYFLFIKKPLLINNEIHLFGIALNVTQEKDYKRKIAENEELYRLVSENATDLIGLHEPDGRVIYYSSSIKDLLGYTSTELIGNYSYSLIHPDDADQVRHTTESGLLEQKGNTRTQYRIRKKSGEYIWFETCTKPIKDEKGQVIRLHSSSRDITERKKAEAAIEKSEKKYRDLVTYSQAIIFTHTLDGIILSTNPILQNLLGYSEMELAGQPFSDLLLSRDRFRFEDYLKDIRQRNKVVGVVTVLDKQGQQKHLLYHNIKVTEPDLEPYILAFAQDITDRLEAENELKMAKDKAEESAKSKELFLANMSHEIRTPMNGILGMAALLKKTTLDPTQQNYLKLIQESAQNLLVIINDVLDIAKIESGKLQFEKIPFNINEILSSAQQSLIYKAEEKDIILHLKPLNLVNSMVNGDPYRLTQILINLLSNAIKFTEVGKVELAADITNETNSDYTIRFSVSDTGIGISPDKLDKIFESFVQAHSDTTRKYGGTGLGLTICKNLIEMQGGHIWAKSKPGNGTTFVFELTYPKVHPTQVLPNTNPTDIDYTSLSSLKVLLAEDNAINQFMAESILNGWGISVDIANNGQEAIHLHEKQAYDVILMDIQMPGMGGVEATKLIRKMPDPVKARIPIIALTANALKGDSDIYMEAGMTDYMSKPYEEEKLFLKISQNVNSKMAGSYSNTLHAETEVTSAPVKHLYNLALVEKLAKGDQTFINKMIELFVTIIPDSINKMQAHAASANWHQLGQVVHSIKPSVDTLMISSIREQLVQIENYARNHQHVDQLPELVSSTTQTLHNIIIELKSEFQL